jgi:hypothetical protein
VCTDPDFEQAQEAYYYVRVLQLPTTRWTLFEEVRKGVTIPLQITLTNHTENNNKYLFE